MSESDGKIRAAAQFRFNDEPSAVAGENVLDDGKTKPRSLFGAAVGDADAIKPFRQPRHMFGRYARPPVDDAHLYRFAGLSPQPDINNLAFLAVFACIFHEVLEYLHQLRRDLPAPPQDHAADAG